jgi:predicted Zn finger-like uncharacterized protein
MGLADGNQKMSLITACPACQTQFEVTDEQLLAYAGKVRCGECDHVFDARSSLVEPVEKVTPTTIEASKESVDVVNTELTADLVISSVEEVATPEVTIDAVINEVEDAPPAVSWNMHPDDESDTDVPEFLRNVPLTDDRPPPPEKKSKRWAFSVLSSVLVLTVLFQFVYFMRVSLAANYPQTKLLLQTVCKMAHCEVSLPHDIEQLTIDDADIQEHRERESVLLFSSVLINHGIVSQAYPVIELTLTNMSDEPVLRKILKPQEYLPTSTKVNEGLAAQQEQPVKASLGVENKAVTGFRVAIAY